MLAALRVLRSRETQAEPYESRRGGAASELVAALFDAAPCDAQFPRGLSALRAEYVEVLAHIFCTSVW
jgi:hypothetical protein